MDSDLRPGLIADLPVLFQNESFIAVHKPPGMHVHQPELARRRVPREMTVLWTLRRQIEKFLYPVHRLDVATEGVLIMAFRSEVAGKMQAALQAGEVTKIYHAICRGWLEDEGMIEIPLERDSNATLADAATRFRTLARVERDYVIGKRYPMARYSLVELRPLTGRWHQIRRHLARISHPIIGDREHGDSHHSRYFREKLDLRGLWLRASEISFQFEGESYHFSAPFSKRWEKACGQLGFLPETITSTTKTYETKTF
jgi:tRNA pseudouridine65 synthase